MLPRWAYPGDEYPSDVTSERGLAGGERTQEGHGEEGLSVPTWLKRGALPNLSGYDAAAAAISQVEAPRRATPLRVR